MNLSGQNLTITYTSNTTIQMIIDGLEAAGLTADPSGDATRSDTMGAITPAEAVPHAMFFGGA